MKPANHRNSYWLQTPKHTLHTDLKHSPTSLTRPESNRFECSLATLLTDHSTNSLMWSIPITRPVSPTCTKDKTHTGLYALLFERARAPRHFLLGKGMEVENCTFLLELFKGTKALTRGHGGNRLCCLHEVSGLHTPTSKYCFLNALQVLMMLSMAHHLIVKNSAARNFAFMALEKHILIHGRL